VVRQKLTLRKPTPADPIKIARSLEIGFRFVDREGRYILQTLAVTYVDSYGDSGGHDRTPIDSTWVDIPLVPETYGEAKA
jgi:hypothetical protein